MRDSRVLTIRTGMAAIALGLIGAVYATGTVASDQGADIEVAVLFDSHDCPVVISERELVVKKGEVVEFQAIRYDLVQFTEAYDIHYWISYTPHTNGVANPSHGGAVFLPPITYYMPETITYRYNIVSEGCLDAPLAGWISVQAGEAFDGEQCESEEDAGTLSYRGRTRRLSDGTCGTQIEWEAEQEKSISVGYTAPTYDGLVRFRR
jgi:hypothetical protein